MSLLRDIFKEAKERGATLPLEPPKPATPTKNHEADFAREAMTALAHSFVDGLPVSPVRSVAERRADEERQAQAQRDDAETQAAREAAAETQRRLVAERPVLEQQIRLAESRAKTAAIEERMRVIAADRSARNKRELSESELRVRALRSLAK
jgi:hypothetical protein